MKLPTSVIICIVLLTSSFRIDNRYNSWTLLKSKNDISAYSGRAGKNGITPTRVEMIVHAAPEKVVQVISDMDKYKLWIPYCKKSFFLQKPSDTLCYGYQRMSAPFVKDRDVALRCSITKTGEQCYEMQILAVPDLVKTEEHAVRIRYLVTQYKIYRDPSGVTHVDQVNEVDIGGSIPTFLVNWLSRYQPYETCENLRKIIDS